MGYRLDIARKIVIRNLGQRIEDIWFHIITNYRLRNNWIPRIWLFKLRIGRNFGILSMNNEMENCLAITCTAPMFCLKSEDKIHGCHSSNSCIVNDIPRHSLFKLEFSHFSFFYHRLELMHWPLINDKMLCYITRRRRNFDNFLFQYKSTSKSFTRSF